MAAGFKKQSPFSKGNGAGLTGSITTTLCRYATLFFGKTNVRLDTDMPAWRTQTNLDLRKSNDVGNPISEVPPPTQ